MKRETKQTLTEKLVKNLEATITDMDKKNTNPVVVKDLDYHAMNVLTMIQVLDGIGEDEKTVDIPNSTGR